MSSFITNIIIEINNKFKLNISFCRNPNLKENVKSLLDELYNSFNHLTSNEEIISSLCNFFIDKLIQHPNNLLLIQIRDEVLYQYIMYCNNDTLFKFAQIDEKFESVSQLLRRRCETFMPDAFEHIDPRKFEEAVEYLFNKYGEKELLRALKYDTENSAYSLEQLLTILCNYYSKDPLCNYDLEAKQKLQHLYGEIYKLYKQLKELDQIKHNLTPKEDKIYE